MTSIRPTLGNPKLDSTAQTMWDAVKMYAMKARAVAALPLGKVSDNDVNAFFVLSNGDGPFTSVLQQVNSSRVARGGYACLTMDVSFFPLLLFLCEFFCFADPSAVRPAI